MLEFFQKRHLVVFYFYSNELGNFPAKTQLPQKSVLTTDINWNLSPSCYKWTMFYLGSNYKIIYNLFFPLIFFFRHKVKLTPGTGRRGKGTSLHFGKKEIYFSAQFFFLSDVMFYKQVLCGRFAIWVIVFFPLVAARTALHSFIQSRETTPREKDLLKSVKVSKGHVTRGNFPCNLQRNGVALQVARKTSLCDTPCLQLVSQRKIAL